MITLDAMWLGILAQVVIFGFFGGRLYSSLDECKRDIKFLFDHHDKTKENASALTDRLARIEMAIEHLSDVVEERRAKRKSVLES